MCSPEYNRRDLEKGLLQARRAWGDGDFRDRIYRDADTRSYRCLDDDEIRDLILHRKGLPRFSDVTSLELWDEFTNGNEELFGGETLFVEFYNYLQIIEKVVERIMYSVVVVGM